MNVGVAERSDNINFVLFICELVHKQCLAKAATNYMNVPDSAALFFSSVDRKSESLRCEQCSSTVYLIMFEIEENIRAATLLSGRC